MSKAMLAKTALSTVLGLFFVNVGIAHFTDTKWFEPIVPQALGNPTFWVLITGVMEIVLGLGIIIPLTRRYSSLFMVLFLIAVYWANLNMWINDIPLDSITLAPIWHVIRLIGQLVMIGTALWVGGWLSKGEAEDR
jgi:uncharacterized membrane protein